MARKGLDNFGVDTVEVFTEEEKEEEKELLVAVPDEDVVVVLGTLE